MITKPTNLLFLLIIILLFFNQNGQAQCNPGEMPTNVIIACENDFIAVQAKNILLTENCVIGYVLLDNTAGVLDNYLAFNNDGIFKWNENISFDEPFYIFSVVGSDKDNDKLPDLDDPNLQISGSYNNTEVVFVVYYPDCTEGVCLLDPPYDKICDTNYSNSTNVCGNNAGIMSKAGSIICSGNFYTTKAINQIIQDGYTTTYVLHDSPSKNGIGTIYATNEEGIFFNDGTLPTNIDLFISSFVGTLNPDGSPILNDECANVALPGTPTRFSNPIELNEIYSACDPITGCLTVEFSISGGAPDFTSNGNYLIEGDYSGSIDRGDIAAFTKCDTDGYTIIVVDDGGNCNHYFEVETVCKPDDLYWYWLSYLEPLQNCHIDDWNILKALYKSTNGNNWNNNTGWKELINNGLSSNCNLDNLFGIDLDEDGRVTHLSLQGNILTGNIPSELGNLKHLNYLDLSYNQLTGSIPSELGNLNNLNHLDLSYNYLTGSIPSELRNIVNMISFGLNNNNFSGCYDSDLTKLCEYYESENVPDRSEWNISEGNNFNASWVDFCEENKGICIRDDLPSCHIEDWTALKAFYESTNFSVGIQNDLWEQTFSRTTPSFDCNLNNLEGVFLDSKGRVLSLNLSNIIEADSLSPEIGNLKNLSSLNLSNNKLKVLPPEVGNLTKLRVLDLSFNQLNNLPNEIGNLKSLVYFGLNNNELISLPPEIGNFDNFKSFDLSYNQLTSLPDEFGNLINLSELQLDNNQLTNLPSEIGNLINLSELELDNNQLTSLPSEIGNLNKLKRLKLHKNKLASLPPEIGNLKNLELLQLYSNELSSLPEEIGMLGNLPHLNLSNNQLTHLPSEIGNLFNLKTLFLHYNKLSDLPAEIGNLLNVKLLILSSNQLNNLPSEIGDLKNLESLYLSDNHLSSLPPEIGNLEKLGLIDWEIIEKNIPRQEIPYEFLLKSLDLSSNRIISLPPSIGNLKNLKDIDLSSNHLTNLPREFINLINLGWLDLSFNHLADLPTEIGVLENLSSLNLSSNQLTYLLPHIGNLRNLSHLYLYSNQLIDLPPRFSELSNLRHLNLSKNKLSVIPLEIKNLDFLDFLDLDNNLLNGIVPIFSQSLGFVDLRYNYFNCNDVNENFESNNEINTFVFNPQKFSDSYVDSTLVFNNVYIVDLEKSDSIILSTNLNIPHNANLSWSKNGELFLSGKKSPSLAIKEMKPKDAGIYKLHLTDSCGINLDYETDPIYVIIKGYDLQGQPIEYNQIMVEFDSRQETKQYEDEILTPNAGWPKHACNCNRELYLWEFPSTEDAIAALLQIDQKIKNLKRKNRPSGGFNNSLSIGDSVKNKIAYRVFLDQINQNFNDSVVVYILDSGLDTLNMNSSEFVYNQAPVDACYESDIAVGYSYTDSAVISTNYIDDLWHGTFGFESITQDLTSKNNPLKIVPLKIFDDKGEGNLFDLVCAIYHAIDHNADIINISAGYQGEPSDILENAIRLAREKGVFITAAAGNDTLNIDSIPYYPAYYASQYNFFEAIDSNFQVYLDSARYDNLISIASINVSDSLSPFSNYGTEAITLATYGENIHSYSLEESDAVASGTSMATYFATKALALEISKNRNRNYDKIWEDFEKNWLVENPVLVDKTRTGKQINFKIEETDIEGCTDPDDPNYFLFATIDDGTCLTDIEYFNNENHSYFDVLVYPNPAKENVFLQCDEAIFLNSDIKIFDLRGKELDFIRLQKFRPYQVELNLSDYSKGVYFIQITTDKENIVKKLVLR